MADNIVTNLWDYITSWPELASYNILSSNIAYGDLPENVERAIYFKEISAIDIYEDDRVNEIWRFFISLDNEKSCYEVMTLVDEKLNHYKGYMGDTAFSYIQKSDKGAPLRQDNGFYLSFIDLNLQYNFIEV